MSGAIIKEIREDNWQLVGKDKKATVTTNVLAAFKHIEC